MPVKEVLAIIFLLGCTAFLCCVGLAIYWSCVSAYWAREARKYRAIAYQLREQL